MNNTTKNQLKAILANVQNIKREDSRRVGVQTSIYNPQQFLYWYTMGYIPKTYFKDDLGRLDKVSFVSASCLASCDLKLWFYFGEFYFSAKIHKNQHGTNYTFADGSRVFIHNNGQIKTFNAEGYCIRHQSTTSVKF